MKKIKIALSALFLIAAVSCNSEKKETTTVPLEEKTDVKVVADQAKVEGKTVLINAANVPQPVNQSFSTKYPKAQRVEWMAYEPIESDELKMDEKYYYVRFNSDGSDYVSWYDNNGGWVKTSTKLINNSGLPDAVNNTLKTKYAGYEIVEVDKENDKNMEMYEIELKKGDDKVKLKILPSGEIFKSK